MLNASNQRTAFLGAIAFSEGTWNQGDRGYNVIVGSRVGAPKLFSDYSRHPHILVDLGGNLKSTAAGRYQELAHNADEYTALLKLPDFGPASQDAMALQQIKEAHALDDIDAGRFDMAVAKCAHLWASFPGAGYNQHENKLAVLRAEFVRLGGVLT